MTVWRALFAALLLPLAFIESASAFDMAVRVGKIEVPLSIGIKCCQTINTADIKGGLQADVDLSRVTLVLPDFNPVCVDTTTKSVSNGLASVVPNAQLPPEVVPRLSWANLYPTARLLINANFFALPDNPYYTACLPALGYTINHGTLLSVYNQVHGEETTTLTLSQNVAATGVRGALINYAQSYGDPSKTALRPNTKDVTYGVSGLWILQNGTYVAPYGVDADSTRPRTVVGLSDDGNRLNIMVVNPGDDSQGAKLKPLADWMKQQGFNNVLNLDGSGSSQLFYRDRNIKSLPSDQIDGANYKTYRPVPIFIGFQ